MGRRREAIVGLALTTAVLAGCSTNNEVDRSESTNGELYQELSYIQGPDGGCSYWPEEETPAFASEELILSIAKEINTRPEKDRQKILKPWLHFVSNEMPTNYSEIMDTLCGPIDREDPMTRSDGNVWYALSGIVSNRCQGFDPLEGGPYEWGDVADRINSTPLPIRRELLPDKAKTASSNIDEFLAAHEC